MFFKVIGIWLILLIVVRLVNYFKKVYRRQEYAIQKGKEGEVQIKNSLSKVQGLRTLSNLYIPTPYGFSEIDLVAVKDGIIFVIESKNYSCKVNGNSYDTQWKLEYGNGNQYDMYNPIMQNDKHLQVLTNLFRGFVPCELKSVVVFSNTSDISEVVNHRSDVIVCNEKDLIDELSNKSLKYDVSKRKETYKVYNLLQRFTNASDDIKKEHIKNVKKYKKNKKRVK